MESQSLQLQYRSSLNDLTPRAEKVAITNLTIIAGENLEYATSIVKAIEDQLFNAHPSLKLPLIYLVDSVLKNIGKEYIPAFQRNLVQVFTSAYNSVDQISKDKLKRVLYTWRTNPGGCIFPPSILSILENSIGLNAVRTKDPRQDIHPQIPNRPAPQARPLIPANTHSSNFRPPPNPQNINQTGILQHIQFLISQKETMRILQPNNTNLAQEISILKDLAKVTSSSLLDNATLLKISTHINSMINESRNPPPQPAFSAPRANVFQGGPVGLGSFSGLLNGQGNHLDLANMGMNLNMGTNNGGLLNLGSLANIDSSTLGQVLKQSGVSGGLGALYKSPLLEKAVINTAKPKPKPQLIPKGVPIIRLVVEDINKHHAGLYYHLYEAIELQCKQCALRFPDFNGKGKSALEAHMDWHFRQKRRQKEKTKKTFSRDWYVGEEEWTKEQPTQAILEGNGTNESNLFFASTSTTTGEGIAAKPESKVPAQEGISKCEICHEVLEKIYDPDDDLWVIMNAVKVQDKIYHEACYRDSSVQGTPVLCKRSFDGQVKEEKDPKRAKI